jgi:hypothetical protein
MGQLRDGKDTYREESFEAAAVAEAPKSSSCVVVGIIAGLLAVSILAGL